MSQESANTSLPPPVEPLQWHQVWLRATTRPSVETFEALVRDPTATPGRAYMWVFVTALILYGLAAFVLFVLPGLLGVSSSEAMDVTTIAGTSVFVLICLAPLSAAFSVLGLMLFAGLSHLIARVLGGTGAFSELVYAFGSYTAPLALITGILTPIPLISCLTLPLGLYALVLNVIAVKAVHRISWGRAVASSPIIYGLILALCAAAVIMVLAVLGQNVQQRLMTPVP